MFVKGTSLKKRVIGSALLALLAILFGMVLLGKALQDNLLMAAGGLPALLMILGLMIYSDRRAKRDPAYAQRVAQARITAKQQQGTNLRANLIGAAIAMAVVIGGLMIRAYLPGFAQLPKADQRLYLMTGGLTIVVLANLAWWQLRKRKRDVR